MKFKGNIVIDKSRDKVVAIFADPQYLHEYQDGFKKKELISGEEGQQGAVSKMLFTRGKDEMELIETIVANRLPEYFEGYYHHKHMDNSMVCRFSELGEQQTQFEYEIDYNRISWVLPRLMAMLFPSLFKKQTDKWMNQFKTFVENHE